MAVITALSWAATSVEALMSAERMRSASSLALAVAASSLRSASALMAASRSAARWALLATSEDAWLTTRAASASAR